MDTPLDSLATLQARLPLARIADRSRITRELQRGGARTPPQVLERLASQLEASIARVERLKTLPLDLETRNTLPIDAHREEIIEALQKHQVIVVCGATGSGKTTQLPKFCLAAGRGAYGLIGHTQPRRIAARSIARRLADEMATTVGGAVGCQVRFDDRTGPDARVKLMTDGILLREIEHDRLLERYDTLIIDEAHERSLNIDFLLGILHRVLPRRPDLRVVITSATIDPQRFARFFDCAPVIEVSGRSYPVEIRYRPLAGNDEEEERELSLPEGVLTAIHELDRDPASGRGDVLVFLPGEKQIREAADELQDAKLHGTEVVPLYGRLAAQEQDRVFARHSARRIVLATNVAETSLTVPGIRNVIDSGLARLSRYSARAKVQRLPIEPISQASANQRSGRCGREQPGICIRLYAETDFGLRPEFTDPEILRTNLASVILQMAALGLGEPADFPFIDPPDTRLINDGYRLLQELKAVDDDRRITSLGRQIASLPLDPKLARMLLSAKHHSCVTEMLVLTSFLAIQDPRERPTEFQRQADESHARFADPRSDFVAVLNLWKAIQQEQATRSKNQLRKWIKENFLSVVRVREWQELHTQLSGALEDIGAKPNASEAAYGELHQAILSGFLSSIGMLDERREYEGARGARFVIAPGTPLASRPPKWVMAGSLVETTRLYARMVAAIEPAWIEAVGAHLLKRSHAEPHWVEERGFVAAFESVSIFGLPLSTRRRVNFGNVDPAVARDIFVREALVEGRTRWSAPFLDFNRKLRMQVESLEAKSRRRDILVDEQALCDFYASRLPVSVNSIATLERWLREEQPRHGQANSAVSHESSLRMIRTDLMSRGTAEITAATFPDVLEVDGNSLALHYVFEPAQADDGVTITVPQPLLNALAPGKLGWLIDGWLNEKITSILRALPKELRKAFVPTPDYAQRALVELDRKLPFDEAMAQWMTRAGGRPITAVQVAQLDIPDHLRMNVRVVDLEGKTVASGRDLSKLRVDVRRAGPVLTVQRPSTTRHRSWDFGDLAAEQVVEQAGIRFAVYPGLRDVGDAVQLTDFSAPEEAVNATRAAVLRLYMLVLPDQFRYACKRFADDREFVLLSRGIDTTESLPDAFAARVFADTFLGDELPPRTKAEFQQRLDAYRSEFGVVVDRVVAHATATLREYRNVRQRLERLPKSAALEDVLAQLKTLLGEKFPRDVAPLLWQHLPRYLKALGRRLEKYGDGRRDAELMRNISPFVQAAREMRADAARPRPDPERERFEWMLEELRVSSFAQDLKTAVPVSDKRVAEQLERARRASR